MNIYNITVPDIDQGFVDFALSLVSDADYPKESATTLLITHAHGVEQSHHALQHMVYYVKKFHGSFVKI